MPRIGRRRFSIFGVVVISKRVGIFRARGRTRRTTAAQSCIDPESWQHPDL